MVRYPIVVAVTSVKTGLLRIAQIATTEHYMHLSTGDWNFAIIKIVIKPYLVFYLYIIGKESFRDHMLYLFSLLRHICVMEIASPGAIVADPTLRQGEACVFKSERERVKSKS